MARNGIPGFDEALSQERRERNLAYLQLPYSICGIEVLDITPRSYCKLVEARTPFIFGGYRELFHASQFITLCQKERVYKTKDLQQKAIRALHAELGKFEFDQCCEEIDEFVDKTFRDMPGGKDGPKSSPIASQMAWLEYTFSGDPWKWDRDRTLNMPLRIIYQQLRCHDKMQGEAVINRLSDKTKSDWLKMVQRGLDDGSIMVEDLAKINAKN